MFKNQNSQFDRPSFWDKVAREKVYPVFDEQISSVIKYELLPEVCAEVSLRYANGQISFPFGNSYHRGFLRHVDDIWFSIHFQVHNRSEITNPYVRIFAICLQQESYPIVMRVHQDPSLRNQLDVYPPHFFEGYAHRSERFSVDAYQLGRECRKYKFYGNGDEEKTIEKYIMPLHGIIAQFLAQNWFMLKTKDPRALSYEEQLSETDKKWTMVGTDCIIYGITKTENCCSGILNCFRTCLDFGSLGENQEVVINPLRDKLANRVVFYMMR